MKKSVAIIIIIMICIFNTSFSVYANSASLSAELKNGSVLFDGFTVSIWRVADASEYLSSPVEFYTAQNIDTPPLRTAVSDLTGRVRFDGLDEGLYLVMMRDNTAPPRYIFAPFLVPLPYNGSNSVQANPKGELPAEPDPDPDPEPDPEPRYDPEPDTASEPTTETLTDTLPESRPEEVFDTLIDILPESPPVPLAESPDDTAEPLFEKPPPAVPLTELPYTGLVRWPIPSLAAAGVLLIIFGCVLKRKRREAP